MSGLAGKVVVVTGASSGIGEACALALARRGCSLVLAARRIDRLRALAVAIRADGGQALAVQTDVRRAEDSARLVALACERFGAIDIFIANAGISMRAALLEVDMAVLKQVMDVNFWGAVHGIRAALPALLQSHGAVVAIGSVAGHVGLPDRSGYSASKFALRGFLDALRVEMLPHGVRVLLVSPGFVRSEIRQTALDAHGRPLQRSPLDESALLQPAQVAQQLIHALKRGKAEIIVGRQGRLAVWLRRWAPALLDRLLARRAAAQTPALATH